jgi:triacylglycerol lipase
LSAELPLARRGWRVMRNRITFAARSTEQCGVVIMPPDKARGAVVVVLPAFTGQTRGPQQLARSEAAARITPVLQQLQRGRHGVHAFYYLACISPASQANHAELALATTTLGWPNGNFVLLPTGNGSAGEAARDAIDRVRWLFADTLEVTVFNLEPELVESLTTALNKKEDRAVVRQVINPSDDPWTAVAAENGLDAAPQALPTRNDSVCLRPTRAGLVPRHPVVFCHGMLALSTLSMQLPENLNCFTPLREFLKERGFRALFPQVAPTSGIVARAHQLREQINRWTDRPVNIIAHSMGGLDARYMISHLGMAERVSSLTTIATPHRGTTLVDWFLTNYRERLPLLRALEAMGINVDGFRDCRPTSCRDFNASTPDMPGVRYFSYGGAVSASHVTPFLRRAWNLLSAVEGPNDGMVSLTSARWGEYLGTLHADHYAQTPDKVFVRPGEDFDALSFYFRLLEDLARRGF